MPEQRPFIEPLDDHNKSLMKSVRPADWKNPEPAGRYNLVVVGAGTAGLVIAAGAAGLGAKVALVEQGLLGGDCLNAGCVPSKGMIRAGRAAFDARQGGEFGAACDSVRVDFEKAMERMRRTRAGLGIHDSAERFRALGVDVFFGEAQFSGPDTVEVGGRKLRFKRAAVCTGARAAVPLIPGLAAAGYLTNETVFTVTKLPKRLAVIGGGPAGCELAQVFARLGSAVTVIQQGRQLLPREDNDASVIVSNALARDGVAVRLSTQVLEVRKTGEGKTVVVGVNGRQSSIPVDAILIAAGRTPNVEGLGLEKAGIGYDSREGVAVDDRLRTSNPRVYAAGDVCSSYRFTHAADAMARIVIANALFNAGRKASSLIIPWCTYTDPEVAHVGRYEQEARDEGIDVLTLTVPLTEVDRAVLDGETEGFARIHLRRGSEAILGATVVARHAGEMISEISLAMTAGLGLSAIGKTIHPYPTQAEAIRKLADVYNRSRLTPGLKKLFTAWLRWQRQ